jgi:hypothetical protein
MAKTWYFAVCEECGEGTRFFVSNPSCTAHYLKGRDRHIQEFLSRHFNCDLRMVNTDTDIDWLWDSGFRHCKVDKELIVRPDGYIPASDGKSARCYTCKDWVDCDCECHLPGACVLHFINCCTWNECPDCGRKNGSDVKSAT